MNTYVYDKIYEAHIQAKIDPTKRNNVVIIFPKFECTTPKINKVIHALVYNRFYCSLFIVSECVRKFNFSF